MRWSVLLVAAACSSSSTPSSSSPAPSAPVAPQPPAFPKETSSLAAVAAFDYLPAKAVDGVLVASSLDQLDARLGPALATFASATGITPAGISHGRPVGVVRIDGGWVAFAEITDANAFAASVPDERRTQRGAIGFVADSAYTIDYVTTAPDPKTSLSHDATFARDVAALQLGALVSWWDEGRATGIAVDGDHVYVRQIGKRGAKRGEPLPAQARARAIAEARAFGILGGEAPPALVKQRDNAELERGRLVDAVREQRDEVAHELALALHSDGDRSPFEYTYVATGGVKPWLAPLIERWRAGEVGTKLAAAEAKLAALDKQVEKARKHAAKSIADLLSSDITFHTGDLDKFARLSPPEVLGTGDVSGFGVRGTGVGTGGGAVGIGGGGRGGGMGSIGTGMRHDPTVTISGGGDSVLRAQLTGRRDRIRRCYEHALERDPKLAAHLTIELVADVDGAITAKVTGGDGELASCVELAASGSSSTAKSSSATFTVTLAP